MPSSPSLPSNDVVNVSVEKPNAETTENDELLHEKALLEQEMVALWDQQDDECAVFDIVQDIVEHAENVIVDRYYDRKSIPYVAEKVMGEMLDVIDVSRILAVPITSSNSPTLSPYPGFEIPIIDSFS